MHCRVAGQPVAFMGRRFATTCFDNPKLLYMKINNLLVFVFELPVK